MHRGDRVVERGDQLSGPAGVEIAQDAHVHPRGERTPAADDHGDARRAVRRERNERVAHGVDEGRLEEVERRTVQRAPDRIAGAMDRERRPH